jgi:pimeloyl-ACP methyl ester carboxylesterase
MHSIHARACAGAVAPTRIVLLPGAYQRASDLLQAGFGTALSERRLPVDLTLVDLDFEYLMDPDACARLAARVLAPARAEGCRRLLLAGISLGGFQALDYVARQGDPAHAVDAAAVDRPAVDGLCLLAPYLGTRLLLAEITGAGGLDAWQAGELAQSDSERRVWRFIQSGCAGLPVFLGYGQADRFAAAHALLAGRLGAGHVGRVEGAHDLPTWRTLWTKFLQREWP